MKGKELEKYIKESVDVFDKVLNKANKITGDKFQHLLLELEKTINKYKVPGK